MNRGVIQGYCYVEEDPRIEGCYTKSC